MSLESLIQRFQPIHPEDKDDWCRARTTLQRKRNLIWHASSGLDFTPMLELSRGRLHGIHQAPQVLRNRYATNSLFFFSDYSTRCLHAMKELYEELDTVEPRELGFKAFNPCGASFFDLLGLPDRTSFDCAEIIPLQLFSNSEAMREGYPNFHASVAPSAIPDDRWHAVYLDITLGFRRQTISRSLLFLHLENLFCFEQVFRAHQMPIDIFYAKRVGGKSGSWDYTHSEKGALMRSILKSDVALRPKIWAADCPDFTKKGEHIFGFANWYQPPWTHMDGDWHWIQKQGSIKSEMGC